MDKPSQFWKGRAMRTLVAGLAITAAVGFSAYHNPVVASDHDDGETNIKSRNTNLTDLYVFREDWETGNVSDSGNLILVMNTNPRSLPRQQYFFNTNALYNFHVTRAANVNATVSGQEDMRFEFSFGAPNAQNQQPVRLNIHKFANGGIQATETFASAGLSTPSNRFLGNSPAPQPVTNQVTTANNNTLNFFAGLREDPFFFDVEGFFKFRASAIPPGAGGPFNPAPPAVNFGGFTSAANASDFAYGYNVNSIVMRVPIGFLAAGSNTTTFDCWETITLPSSITAFQ